MLAFRYVRNLWDYIAILEHFEKSFTNVRVHEQKTFYSKINKFTI